MPLAFLMFAQQDQASWSKILNDLDVKKVLTGIIIFFGTTVLSFVVGRWWGKHRAKKEWQTKQFLGRVMVSLNSFAEGALKIRTIFERSLEEVFLNPVAVDKIRRASLQTTVDNPLLPIEKKDRWYLLNFVLNAVAELFTTGLVRYDAGEPLKPVVYLIFLTCEVVGEDRIRKVRAMMVRKDQLVDFPYWDGMPKLEQHWHEDRIVTLRRAAELYKKEPDNFLALEIYV
jgi:hypothetical protein